MALCLFRLPLSELRAPAVLPDPAHSSESMAAGASSCALPPPRCWPPERAGQVEPLA